METSGNSLQFSIDHSGHIWLSPFATGDMAIYYRGRGKVVDVIISVCRPEISFWHHGARAFVIRSTHVDCAIAQLNQFAHGPLQ